METIKIGIRFLGDEWCFSFWGYSTVLILPELKKDKLPALQKNWSSAYRWWMARSSTIASEVRRIGTKETIFCNQKRPWTKNENRTGKTTAVYTQRISNFVLYFCVVCIHPYLKLTSRQCELQQTNQLALNPDDIILYIINTEVINAVKHLIIFPLEYFFCSTKSNFNKERLNSACSSLQ